MIGLVNKPGLSVSSTIVIRTTIIGISWLEYQAINVIFLINEIVESRVLSHFLITFWLKDVGKWAITLSFPLGERFTGGNMAATGRYAFLPTEMIIGFPFIIQADFLFVSSRESIIFNNNWNQGILHCISLFFCSAFRTLMSVNLPLSLKTWVYRYLPYDIPRYQHITQVRDAI